MSGALVIQTSFLGDAILTTPLLRELAARGPVSLVVTKAAAALFEGSTDVARLVVYDKRGADSGVGGLLRLARSVRATSPADVAYLAQGSHRSGALALAAGYRRRVGLATASGRHWYTARIAAPPGAHHAERLWRLAGAGREPNEGELRPRLEPGATHEAEVDALFGPGGAGSDPLVALAPGSVWATKRWPYYAELARALVPAARVVIIGGSDDRDLARAVADAAGPRVVDATGQLSLLASAALIRRCRVLVTNDSAPLHLASAVNTPTVAIFGPTVTGFGFGPLAERHAVAEVAGLSCRPCHTHGPMRCPLSHFRCMRDLRPEQVLEAARRLSGIPG